MNTQTPLRRVVVAWILFSLASYALVPSVWSQETAPTRSDKPSAKVRFRPPTQAAPAVRLTGGSRGVGDATLKLEVLAPDDVGLTIHQQPSLFWYQSWPANARFELTLLRENQIQPALQVMLESPREAGIHRLRLADHGVKLLAGVEYQWVVALIKDPDRRSGDLVSSGVIQWIEAPAGLKQQLEQLPAGSHAAAYAEAGIWYDALAALSDRVEADPDDRELREARLDLLRQVGLTVSVGGP